MSEPNALDVSRKWCCGCTRKKGNSVFSSLSVSNQDLITMEVDILNAQARALQNSQAGPVEKRRHEPRRPLKPTEDGGSLFARENQGNSQPALGAHDTIQPIELSAEDVLIQKE